MMMLMMLMVTMTTTMMTIIIKYDNKSFTNVSLIAAHSSINITKTIETPPIKIIETPLIKKEQQSPTRTFF